VLRVVDRMHALHPRDVRTLARRALARLAIVDVEGAPADVMRALEIAPDVIWVRSTAAVVAIGRDRYDEAVEHLTAVFERDPGEVRASQ